MNIKFIYIYIYIHTHTHTRVCTHICVCVCMYIYIFIYLFIYLFNLTPVRVRLDKSLQKCVCARNCRFVKCLALDATLSGLSVYVMICTALCTLCACKQQKLIMPRTTDGNYMHNQIHRCSGMSRSWTQNGVFCSHTQLFYRKLGESYALRPRPDQLASIIPSLL